MNCKILSSQSFRGFKGILASSIAISSCIAAPAMAETIAIYGGNVILDAQQGSIGPAIITVTDGRITAITRGGADTEVKADKIVDLSAKTLLPGLIDTHTHLSFDPGGDYWREAVDPDEWSTVIATKNAALTLRAGFTTVRDVGSSAQVMQSIRRGTASGIIDGPRIQTGGNSIAIIGGHADVSGFRPHINDALATGFTCTGVTECAATVRKASKNGSDLIKITATGGVLSQQARGLDQHFTNEEMRAIADTAHALGMKVAAHAHGPRGIEGAANAGIDSIEHCTFADDKSIAAMKSNGTACVPTLLAFIGVKEGLGKGVYTAPVEAKIRQTLDALGQAPTAMRKAGVPIVFGTDSGVTAHGRNAQEFALMVEYIGMSPRETLESATTAAAKLMGLENEIGKIAVGFSADLIAVEGDPLTDVKTLENIDWVMARGRIIN